MISYLCGKIAQKLPSALVIDINGVGFLVNANPVAIAAGNVGETITLHTHMTVTERDFSFNLYGFCTREERDMYRRLLSISGVGAKSALALLSQMSVQDLLIALMAEDAKAIAKAPGIGLKSAQRIIIELKGKIGNDDLLEQIGRPAQAFSAGESSVIQDSIEAMIALGFPPSEAAKAVTAVKDDGSTADELIRLALKRFSF